MGLISKLQEKVLLLRPLDTRHRCSRLGFTASSVFYTKQATKGLKQGTLTEGKGSVQLTSSLR